MCLRFANYRYLYEFQLASSSSSNRMNSTKLECATRASVCNYVWIIITFFRLFRMFCIVFLFWILLLLFSFVVHRFSGINRPLRWWLSTMSTKQWISFFLLQLPHVNIYRQTRFQHDFYIFSPDWPSNNSTSRKKTIETRQNNNKNRMYRTKTEKMPTNKYAHKYN